MLTQVPRPLFGNNFSLLAPCSNFVNNHDSCLSTASNDGPICSVPKKTIHRKTADRSATKSCNVSTFDVVSSGNISVSWTAFVVSVDSDGSIEYKRICLVGGTVEGLICFSDFEISIELENQKAWQPSEWAWDSDFYIYHRALPRTCGAGMPWWLWYVRNMGCGAC